MKYMIVSAVLYDWNCEPNHTEFTVLFVDKWLVKFFEYFSELIPEQLCTL